MDNDISKVLVAFDGSNQAMNAVRYAGRSFDPGTSEIVLFLVGTEVPQSYWDMGKQTAMPEKEVMDKWYTHQNKVIIDVLEKAKKVLAEEGFPQDRITVKTKTREIGIARDIITESRNDYDAIVIGRTGISNHIGISIGNVATKLIDKITKIPVFVVGGVPDPGKIIIGFDGSKGAKKSVSVAVKMLIKRNPQVLICNVLRSLNLFEINNDIFNMGLNNSDFSQEEKKRVSRHEEEMGKNLDKAVKKLIGAGMNNGKVKSMILKGYTSRAVGLMETAGKGGYGTVMVGRRGNSVVKEFILGSVGRKILQMAEDKAVCIVN